MRDALDYAVNTRKKLVVAGAGNDNTDAKFYPAGYADESVFMNKLLAVAAAGIYDNQNEIFQNECRADYSNYGSWISTAAPGTNILSTYIENYYASMDGTSMATPFVAAAAARRWGYKLNDTNAAVGAAIKASGKEITADDECWPASMTRVRMVNVAALLDRGGLNGYVFNAVSG